MWRAEVCLVTGAASGLGKALATELLQQGAIVYLCDINLPALEACAVELAGKHRTRHALPLDICNLAAFREAIQRVVREQGRIDLLINNAGIHIGGPAEALSDAHWQRVFDVNFLGAVNGTRAAYEQMLRQKSGSIINISSLAGLTPTPTQSAYSASKWGVAGFTLSLREEAKAQGINLTLVCPGAIATNIFTHGQLVGVADAGRFQRLTKHMYPADKAALRILRAAQKHKALLTFPFYATLLVWAYRLHPALLWPYYAALRKIGK